MGRTKRRRQRKQVAYLTGKADESQRQLCLEWSKRIESWLEEIHRRAARLEAGENPNERVERIFEVVDHAERLLAACGPQVDSAVGTETRRVLIAECCKAVAHLYGPTMYRVVAHRWYDGWRDIDRHQRSMIANADARSLSLGA